MMLIDPSLHAKARDMANETIVAMQSAVSNADIVNGLGDVSRLLIADRTLEALKKLRSMYAIEATYLNPEPIAEKLEKAVA